MHSELQNKEEITKILIDKILTKDTVINSPQLPKEVEFITFINNKEYHIVEFIKHYDEQFNQSRMNENQKIKIISCLKGEALEWGNVVLKECQTWEKVKKRLMDRYWNKELQDDLRREFEPEQKKCNPMKVE